MVSVYRVGDGGAGDDSGTGHGNGNGRDPANPLGAILRIDPLGSNSANTAYGIPAANPFVGQAGFVAEIFAYGFRNPFRMAFDRATGQLWAGDVGQNAIEEIDIVSAGGNYGWNWKEGSFFFDGNGAGPGFVTDIDPGAPPGLIDPVAEYDHDEGIAVIGGYVYRGNTIAALQGRYVFGDFGGAGGRLFYLESDNSIREFALAKQQALGMAVNGFAEDAAANLYVLANIPGPLDAASGVVLRIDPAAAAGAFDVSGVWWDPARSGQGLQFLQTGNSVSGVWYLYDTNGQDMWLTFRGELSGNTLSADLLSFTGPPLGAPWNIDEVIDSNAGTITLEFLSPFAATMNYTVNGVSDKLHLAPF